MDDPIRHSGQAGPRAPLPIWFFVGLILAACGAILVAAAFLVETPARVVVVTAMPPGLWWGGGMAVLGIVFVWVGLRGRRR